MHEKVAKPWGISKMLERALKREVVINKLTGQYGVIMEDGKIEITSYESDTGEIRSYLGPRVDRTEDWKTLMDAPG